MKIVGISCVRNEEDVVEAFVRHNLTHCDDLLILNHGSTDTTLDILHSLQSEGLRVHVVTDCTLGNLQTVHMARLLQMALHDFKADWIACLDADEFIQGPFREALARNFEADESQFCCRLRLINYRAHPEDKKEIINPVERLTYHEEGELQPADLYASKLMVPAGLARQEGAFVERGSHRFSINGTDVPSKWINELALAHYPLRHPAQVGSKVTSYAFQKYCARGTRSSSSDIYEGLYQKMRRSYSGFAGEFHQLRASWVSAVKEGCSLEQQPAEYRGGALRYTPARHDVDQLIRNILDLGENLAASQISGEAIVASSPTIHLSLCDPHGIDHLNARAFPVSAASFSAMPVSLQGLTRKDQINIGISMETGILEIIEVALKFESGEVQTYTGKPLRLLLSVNEDGLMVYNSAMVKFLIASRPIVLTLAGERLFAGGVPTEVILSTRQILDSHRTRLAVFDLATIRQLHGMADSKTDNRARYSIGSNLHFDRFGEGREFLGPGWGKAKDWGTWSDGAQSTLSLELDRPTAGALRLGILVRQRKGGALKLGVSLDNHLLGAWELKDDHYQWLTVTIPASPRVRCELGLAFRLEAMEGSLTEGVGFGIKQLYVEEMGWRQRLLKAYRRGRSLIVSRFLGVFGVNRIILGKEIDFHQEGGGIWLLGKGWRKPSSTGCKMLYDRADLKARLALTWPPINQLVLKMRARVDQEILDQQGGRLAVVVGEHRLFLQKVGSEMSTSAWFEVVLPKGAFQDGELHLKFWKQQGNLEIEKLVLERAGKPERVAAP